MKVLHDETVDEPMCAHTDVAVVSDEEIDLNTHPASLESGSE